MIALQVLPRLGCIVPEDASLLPPAALAGALTSRAFAAPPLRTAWLTAEAAAARAALEAIAMEDDSWLAPPVGGDKDGSGDEGGSAASEAAIAALHGLFARCMWVAPRGARVALVDTVLGAGINVRPRPCAKPCSGLCEVSAVSADLPPLTL